MLAALVLPLLALTTALQSPGGSDCPAGTRLVEERRTETDSAIYIQPVCERIEASPPLYAPGFTTETRLIDAAIQFTRVNGWSPQEIERVSNALQHARGFELTHNSAKVRSVWNAIEGRVSDPNLALASKKAEGPKVLASGWQSNRFADCTIFAIASATGQPYGVVAARTNELIKSAKWRSEFYRKNPEEVFGTGGGLNDYEVALLAEIFGQVASVEPADYAGTLRAGHPIVIPVATPAETGHEVVLARTFKRGGTDWFEVIDSTRKNRDERLFLSTTDLAAIALAKGLTVDSGPDKQVPLLRK